METYSTIQENRALSVKLGKSPPCCWATEQVGYIVRLWGITAYGHDVLEERETKTYGDAEQVKRELTMLTTNDTNTQKLTPAETGEKEGARNENRN